MIKINHFLWIHYGIVYILIVLIHDMDVSLICNDEMVMSYWHFDVWKKITFFDHHKRCWYVMLYVNNIIRVVSGYIIFELSKCIWPLFVFEIRWYIVWLNCWK